MTRDEYNDYCRSLPSTTHVVQWGGADVWKIGGKVFAICGWDDGETPAVTFKVTDIGFEVLRECPGCRPAPYLASRGFTWIQRYDDSQLSDDELKQHLRQSYDLVAGKLSKKKRRALGID